MRPVVHEDKIVHIKVVPEKLPNYIRYCTGWLAPGEIPSATEMVTTVKQYTEGPDWFCSKMNLALACDYGPKLQEFGMDIRRLKYCCGKMTGYNGPLYRGLDLSAVEIGEMIKLKRFYFPSFTSASFDKNKAFKKSHILVLECSDASWTLLTNPSLSKYFSEEHEVIISCYTLFEFDKQEGNKIYLKAQRQCPRKAQELPGDPGRAQWLAKLAGWLACR